MTTRPRRRYLRRLVLSGALLLAAAALAGAGLLAHLTRDLPRFERLLDYEPKETTHIFASDGTLVGELYEERRTVIAQAEIPERMKHAILAAEDAQFYEHEGLDYSGIARALWKNLSSGETRQGASTITQQVVKTFLLTPERTYERKLKEMILARRLEQNLSKDEILYLYLNQIYFGHRRYGIVEAARHYFGKTVRELTIGEAALLAGLPQSPARLSPLTHPERAKQRQLYVLGQMRRLGFITEEEHAREVERPIEVAPRPGPRAGGYYLAEVRRQLVARYGEKRVLTGGLRVTTGMDLTLQTFADRAVREGLLAYERRHGYRGPIGQATAEQLEEATRLAAEAPEGMLVDVKASRLRAATQGALVTAVVVSRDADGLLVSFGGPEVRLTPAQLTFAGRPVEKLAKDDLVLLELFELREGVPHFRLAQEPQVEGALVAIDPSTRRVRALVGGFDIDRSRFNRATQAERQPGSAFKPFVFGAALESGRWTAASLVVDAPETFRDPWTGKEWKPQNYERNVFDGTITFERALAHSKNTVAVRLISELGVEAVIDFARRAGITRPLPKSFTLALGTGEVSPIELASGYATIAAMGVEASPVLIEKVLDRNGALLESHHDRPRPRISPAIAYVLTRLLEAVVQDGTGRRAAVLQRPVAGKTGTTSDGRDAWFAGFTPELVTVSWVGFDDHRALGRGETGSHTALPAWLSFMQAAHEGKPPTAFALPEGIELAAIDPQTGLLAAEGAEAEQMAFASGTAPTERSIAPGRSAQDLPVELFLGMPSSGLP